jgi:uncharacterized protein YecT (DUF1311 family)
MKRVLWALAVFGLSALIFSVAHGQTQAELNEEAAKAAKKSDDSLNTVYKELLNIAGDEKAKEMLRVSQRAWIKFRDAECDFAADNYRDGSIKPLIYWTCYKQLTDARIAELKAHIKDRKDH